MFWKIEKFGPSLDICKTARLLEIDIDTLERWREEKRIMRREEQLRSAYRAFRRARRIEPEDDGLDVLRFALIHSLSHALIRQFSIECGYSAASLQERLYATAGDDETDSMCGVLLMTAAPDSEGTLGGLVRLATPLLFASHLDPFRRPRVRGSW